MRLFALAVLLLALLPSCAAGEEQTPASMPDSTATRAATATGTTPPSETPTATPEPTPRPPDPVMEMVTYRDEQANLTLDYPADWFRYAPDDLDLAQGRPYTVTFSPGEPGLDGMVENSPSDDRPPTGAERIDLVVRPGAPATLAEAVAQQEEALAAADPAPTITAREPWQLSNAVPAHRWRLDTNGRDIHLLLTLIDGRTILLRGQTSAEQFEQVARSLRPLARP